MPRMLALPALLLCLVLPAQAASPEAGTTPAADAALGKALAASGLKTVVDEDGDYRMTLELASGRTQLVFVLSRVETVGSLRLRQVWSTGYAFQGSALDAKVANRLLEDSSRTIVGGWVRHPSTATFVVRIPADASPAELRDAVEAAAVTADEMELSLSGAKDEF